MPSLQVCVLAHVSIVSKTGQVPPWALNFCSDFEYMSNVITNSVQKECYSFYLTDESFSLGLKFEVVFEIRPRSSSGILLHGHSVNGEYLNMHMRNGQV